MLAHEAGHRGPSTIAAEAMVTVARSLTQLEVGELGVLSFGERARLLHALGQPFTDEAAALALSQLTFRQRSTNAVETLSSVLAVMRDARSRLAARPVASAAGQALPTQLVVLLSDGLLFDSGNREQVRRLLREAQEERLLVVLLVLDNPASNSGRSVTEVQSVRFEGTKVVVESYFEDCPFAFYVVLRDINSLPETLADALTQWFELLADRE